MHFIHLSTLLLATPSLLAAASVVTRSPVQADISGGTHSSAPCISAGSGHVVFLSGAANLTTNAVDPQSFSIFRWDRQSDTIALVSSAINGNAAQGISAWPSVSTNGRYVAFISDASNIVAGDLNNATDVFVRDMETGTTTIASAGLHAPPAGLRNSNPLIAGTGSRIFFESTGTLTPEEDANGGTDVFAHEGGSNVLVSARASDGKAAGKPATLAAIDSEGARVAFISGAWNEIIPDAGNNGGSDLYVRHMQSQTTSWISAVGSNFVGSYNCATAAFSDDGRYLVFTARAGASPAAVFRHAFASGITELVATNAWTNEPVQISSNGRYVLFGTGTNIYRWDADNQTSELVNAALNGAMPNNGSSRAARMSSDGSMVAFISSSWGLVTNTPIIGFQIYVRNMVDQQTRLVSVTPSGAGSNSSCEDALLDISPDGARICFSTAAGDLVAGDMNRCTDVFTFEVNSGVIELISRRHSSHLARRTALAHSMVSATGVSTNGIRIAFLSFDSNLVPNDTNVVADPFVADTVSGNILGSPDPSGRGVRALALSGDGQHLVAARYLSAYSSETLVRYDLANGTNHAVLTGTRPRETAAPAINATGELIAYKTGGTTPLVIFNTVGMTNVFSTNLPTVALKARELQDAVFTPDSRFALYGSGNTLQALDLMTGEVQSTPFDSTNSTISVSANSRFVTFFDILTHRRDLIEQINLNLGHVLRDTTISGDGRFVVGTTIHPASPQILLFDCQTGETNILSTSPSGEPGNGPSLNPVITPDGRYVAFRTLASNLVSAPIGQRHQIVLRDRLLGTLTLLSAAADGAPGNGSSGKPILSLDGTTIVFQSMANNLTAGDSNDRRDIFVAKLGAPDSDADGMDDDWEMAYFSTLSRTGDGDFDADGENDRAEFLAGTDPTNTSSIFRVIRLQRLGDDTTQLMWTGSSSRGYTVEYRDDFSTPGWTPLPTSISWNGDTASATVAGGSSARFYRVVRVP